LAAHTDYEERLDGLLEVISASTGLPLDLPRREKYAVPHLVSTPLGSLYSVPLVREKGPADAPCWTEPRVHCAAHGDPDCEDCFVYLEARERADAAGQSPPAPVARAAGE